MYYGQVSVSTPHRSKSWKVRTLVCESSPDVRVAFREAIETAHIVASLVPAGFTIEFRMFGPGATGFCLPWSYEVPKDKKARKAARLDEVMTCDMLTPFY